MTFVKPSRNFIYRLFISSMLIILLLSLIYFSLSPVAKWLFFTAAAIATASAQWEFYTLCKSKGLSPLSSYGILSGILFIFAVFKASIGPGFFLLPYAVLGFSLLFGFIHFFFRDKNPIQNLSATFFGIIYIAIPLSTAILINYSWHPKTGLDGRWWLLFVLTLAKTSDTAAYFIGKGFGKRVFAPNLSPKKTLEGVLAAVLFPIGVSLLFPPLIQSLTGADPLGITPFEASLFAIAISALAQLGDLAESLLKRDANVKDSNHLPGLGGTLDMIDSLLFTLPFAYLTLLLMHKEIL